MSLPTKRFRLSAKNFFLTYPECSLSKDDALTQLLAIPLPTNKKFIRVTREFHEDGNPHIHVLLQLEGKAQITNQRIFDLRHLHSSRCFHPNIQSVKSCSDVKAYVEKDGDYTDWGEFQIDSRYSRGGTHDLLTRYAGASNATSVQELLQIIKEKDPRSFSLQYHNIRANAERIFARPVAMFRSNWAYSSFHVTQGIQQWLVTNFDENSAARPFENNIFILKENIDRPISLILEGPSRTGKTEWARSLGPHNYICGYMDFNPHTFRNDVMYNIIDNIAPRDLKLKHWKQLIGAERDWQSKYKYGKKPVQIIGGIPAIILCNPGSDSSYSEFLDKRENISLRQWTRQNARFEFITSPLYTLQRDGIDTTMTMT
uniref:Replication-associated protein n=1 Tax=Dioscorea alata TaxID=55571 RepID=A0A0G2R256_DIOAL|nr:replication-associated protein [Dioscorea alata]AIG55171.1 replication-associated protein [Dioscorea alata]